MSKKRPEPYIHRNPGDVIRSGDWNELQVLSRQELHSHNHTGGENGKLISREAIEDKSINGEKIDPSADIKLNSLHIGEKININNINIGERLVSLNNDKINRRGDDHIEGNLSISNSLTIGTGKQDNPTNLIVNGKINAANHFKVLSHNLISNSFMNRLDGNIPDGFAIGYYAHESSTINIEVVNPFTKGFEGPYLENKPAGAASSPELATKDNPYWYGRWYKGPRAARGGLAGGWEDKNDGHILKITGTRRVSKSYYGNVYVKFPKESRCLTQALLFRAWIKIVKGAVDFGTDQGTSPRYTRELTEKSPQGWHFINDIIGSSHITDINSAHSFIFKALGEDENNNGEFEIYLALPYLANIETDDSPHWSASVSDVLSDSGAICNQVAIGRNPSGPVNYPYPYETIGTIHPGHNLRLHSYQAIILHCGNSSSPTFMVNHDGLVQYKTMGQFS